MKNRLIILFENSNYQDLDKDDVVFAYNVKCLHKNVICDNKLVFNPWEASKNEEPRELIFSVLRDYRNDVSMIANTMYSNFFAMVFSYFKQLSEIVKEHKISTILLIGGCQRTFVTFEKAEGEGTPFLYRHEWLYNPLIYQFAKNNDIVVEWRNVDSFSLRFIMLNCFREIYIISSELIKEIGNSIKYKNKSLLKLRDLDFEKYNAVSFTNLEGQYRFIKSLTVLGSLKFLHITHRKFDDECIELKGWMSIKQIFSNLQSCLSIKSHSIDDNILVREYGLSFSSKAIERAIRTEYFVYKNAIGRLDKLAKHLFHRDVKCMLTCTSQGRSMVKYTELGKMYNLKHINCQYVTLGQRNFPILNLADEYYLFEKGSYNFYKSKSSCFRFYIPQLAEGSFKGIDKNIVVIYTQPDRYTVTYLELLRQLGESRIFTRYKVYVKLHYRQDHIDDFERVCDYYGFVLFHNDVSIKELMLKSCLSISMTSSVLSESLFYRVPAIMYINEPRLKQHVIESGIGYPEVNYTASNINELLYLIDSISYSDYEDRLDAFMKNNSGVSIPNIFK